MTNPDGHPESLQASHPQNLAAVRSGAFSRTGRVLAPRAAEVAEAILSVGHVDGLDQLGAEEIGSLVALVEALDRELDKRGPVTRDGGPRKILELRLRASGRLERWLSAYGLTPAARAELLATLATGGLAHEIAQRRRASASPKAE